jgi:hypothetical protein
LTIISIAKLEVIVNETVKEYPYRKRDGAADSRLPEHKRYPVEAKKAFRWTIEQMLEAEMDEHLGYGKHSPEGGQERQ